MKGILCLYLFLFIYKSAKLNFTPAIDGIIHEFENFEKIDSFIEVDPEEGKIPPFKTECYIAYDENNIYFAFKCYDDVKTIRKTLTKRDNFAMDDMVVIYLDTYGKGREGYIFGTNPLGVQYDGIKGSPPQNLEDWAFDTYFEVKSFIGDSFWSCEFKIPFSSLRFENKEKQEWKFAVVRVRPRESLEMYVFPLISKNNPSFFGQCATLLIPERIYLKEKRHEFIPYLISSESGFKEEKYYKSDIFKINFGLSGKTKILQNLILDYAIKPDFAQIETDFPQIDVNTPFALYYPEKRPLFMEGKEMIETPISAIYTRMINNPLYALKLTGRISEFDLYLLSSYDKNTIYILPFEDASSSLLTDKKSFINILRLKRDFLNKESYFGILITDREVQKDEFDNGFGRIFGFDTKIRFLKHYTFEYQGIYSSTKESEDTNLFILPLEFKNYTSRFDGEKFDGFGQKISVGATFRNLFSSINYSDYSPTFRSDLGFIRKNNFRKGTIYISPIIYPNKYGFNSISASFKYEKELNYKNIIKNEDFCFRFTPTLSFAQTNFGISWNKFNERVLNIYTKDYEYFKNFKNLNFYLNSTPMKWLSFETGLNMGNSIYYSYPKYLPAYQISLWGYFNLLFTKFIFSIGGERYYLYKEKYKNLIYDVSTIWTSIHYSFTKSLSFRFTFTYNTYYKNPGFYPLLSYELTPFTLFYLGANINTIKYHYKIEGNDHQIFLKFQYSFKM